MHAFGALRHYNGRITRVGADRTIRPKREGGREDWREGERRAGETAKKKPRSETVMSLMSELLSARRWTVDRSRGVNAPFACLAPDSNPVPGVRLTIAAIAVAKKKHHKSLIDAATHITYIVCM